MARLTPKKFRQAIGTAIGGDETDDRTTAIFNTYRTVLYAAIPGKQRRGSEGWGITLERVQKTLLASLRRSHAKARNEVSG